MYCALVRGNGSPPLSFSLSSDSGRENNALRVLLGKVEHTGARFKSRIVGIAVARGPPAWTAAFCLSLLMTQRHTGMGGGKMGQNGSQYRRMGVKHDQTVELNGGIIMLKNERGREMEAERE